MGHTFIRDSVLAYRDFAPIDKLIFSLIERGSARYKRFYPSITTLGSWAGVGRQHASTSVNRLVVGGYITRTTKKEAGCVKFGIGAMPLRRRLKEGKKEGGIVLDNELMQSGALHASWKLVCGALIRLDGIRLSMEENGKGERHAPTIGEIGRMVGLRYDTCINILNGMIDKSWIDAHKVAVSRRSQCLGFEFRWLPGACRNDDTGGAEMTTQGAPK